MKLRNIILGIAWAVGILLSPGIAFSALDLITFHTNPETPGPNQAVTISIQSYAVPLDSAMLTWYIDKEVVASGIGEKSIQTTTTEFGNAVTVNVVIMTASGGRFDKQLILKPIEVDILWEADTFVPPFYKGKALPTYKSIVKLSAIPRFNAFASDPSLYSYTWTANNTQGLGQKSGKNGVLLPMKYSGSAVPVKVSVNNLASTGEGGGASKNIATVDPILLFYEDAPLLGIRLDRALSGAVVTNGTSFTIRAVPYFFSNDDVENSNLVSLWYKDNVKFAPGLDSNTLTIGKEGASAQGSTIGLSIQNMKRILQAADAEVSVNFSQE
ncbi:MAG: hypothetical protein AAB869_02700 [Patescibacteria group bacterium]